MANQFTKGTRTQHDESTKDKIRAELLSQRLFKFAKAKGKSAQKQAMSQAQVAAAKVVIERGKPALQSVEATVNEVQRTEEEIQASLAHLVSSNPSVLKQLVDADPGLRAAIQSMLTGAPSVVEPQQTQRSNEDDSKSQAA